MTTKINKKPKYSGLAKYITIISSVLYNVFFTVFIITGIVLVTLNFNSKTILIKAGYMLIVSGIASFILNLRYFLAGLDLKKKKVAILSLVAFFLGLSVLSSIGNVIIFKELRKKQKEFFDEFQPQERKIENINIESSITKFNNFDNLNKQI
ncbi:hypothetical protein [Metamycoplasma neophronis]|uniref:Uncharacterized protein n=1 Tax=Metamycoplasma neophronis TaxID=872983 RepID=A0ABY2Z430_9BACT|nr:hypothetical protein [Metamycoplasma neophronis]TPR53905.1 hypothetical protein FJR74_01960 [Metamycoplasma neophronis]